MITLLSRLWCFAFLLAALPLAAEESSNAPIPPHTIPEGTTFLMRLEDRLDTNRLQQGKHFKAKLAEDLTAPDVENGFHARLLLSFDEIETNHGWVPLIATVTGVPGEHGVKPPDEEGEIERRGMNKRHEVERAGAGAGVGAIGGAVAGGGRGAAIGASIGAAAGAVSGFFMDRNLRLDKGTALEVRLDHPLQVPWR